MKVNRPSAPKRTSSGSNAGTRPLKPCSNTTGKNKGYIKVPKRAGVKEY